MIEPIAAELRSMDYDYSQATGIVLSSLLLS